MNRKIPAPAPKEIPSAAGAERKETKMEHTPLTSHDLLLLKKKRRRRKKLLASIAVLLCLGAAGGGAFFFWQRSAAAAGETVQIVAGEQEELTYARIHTIVGNEMETVLLDAAAVERMETGSAPEGELFSEEDGETKSWQIPVGTDVITSLGVTTTFSRLSAGDVIAVLTEEGTDNILKIWIIQ